MAKLGAAARLTGATISPRSATARIGVRMSLDLLLTLIVTAVATALVVGYQVLRRMGSGRDDQRP